MKRLFFTHPLQLLLVFVVTVTMTCSSQDQPVLPSDEPSVKYGSANADTQKIQLATSSLPFFTDPIRLSAVGQVSVNRQSLFVDARTGNDQNTGITRQFPYASIQAALDDARPGDTIYIAPGLYRESIRPKASGTAEEPITLIASDGPGTVTIRGSEPSSSLSWAPLSNNSIGLPESVDPAKVYVADISEWGLKKAPRFMVMLDENEQIQLRLNPAREPDFRVDTEWKFNEFWWSANGGSSVAACDPRSNADQDCDLGNRSFTELTDTRDDNEPNGIEAGNLTKLGDLTGATLVAMDAHHALYVYRRIIVKADAANGKVYVDEACDNDGEPGLGWGSKYYVENAPSLLDQPGEWWYDSKQGLLYLWPPVDANPGLLPIEISRLDTAFDLSDTSYITLDDLSIELYNANAYQIINKKRTSAAIGNQILNCNIRYADKGIVLYHFVQGEDPQLAITDFTLANSEISLMDSTGIDSYFGWNEAPSPLKFQYPGIHDITIRNNTFHDLGFNSSDRSAVGVRFFYPDRIFFTENHIYNVAQNGIHFHLSLIDSDKTYNVAPEHIKLGEILISNNLIEKTCQAASDCGGLKIGGSNRPDTHIFRDVLITGNTFRDIYGWSFVSIQRRLNTLGDGNGFYLDYATGVHVYRNIAYGNSGAGFKLSCLWRDGDSIFYNNVSANNFLYGIKTTGMGSCDDHGGSVNTQFVNNILINNGLAGIELLSSRAQDYGNLVIDHNLYYQNGWDTAVGGTGADILLYQDKGRLSILRGVPDINENTPWETSGISADPAFLNYDISDHTEFVSSVQQFEPSSQSFSILDSGSSSLPSSLDDLLVRFNIDDIHCGNSFEIGRYEIYRKMPEDMTSDPQSEWPDRLFAPICNSLVR